MASVPSGISICRHRTVAALTSDQTRVTLSFPAVTALNATRGDVFGAARLMKIARTLAPSVVMRFVLLLNVETMVSAVMDSVRRIRAKNVERPMIAQGLINASMGSVWVSRR